jgi:hypothetical protein
MEKTNDLVERYVDRGTLPAGGERKEIQNELRSLIRDQLDDRYRHAHRDVVGYYSNWATRAKQFPTRATVPSGRVISDHGACAATRLVVIPALVVVIASSWPSCWSSRRR